MIISGAPGPAMRGSVLLLADGLDPNVADHWIAAMEGLGWEVLRGSLESDTHDFRAVFGRSPIRSGAALRSAAKRNPNLRVVGLQVEGDSWLMRYLGVADQVVPIGDARAAGTALDKSDAEYFGIRWPRASWALVASCALGWCIVFTQSLKGPWDSLPWVALIAGVWVSGMARTRKLRLEMLLVAFWLVPVLLSMM
jgi:hypothetical protein